MAPSDEKKVKASSSKDKEKKPKEEKVGPSAATGAVCSVEVYALPCRRHAAPAGGGSGRGGRCRCLTLCRLASRAAQEKKEKKDKDKDKKDKEPKEKKDKDKDKSKDKGAVWRRLSATSRLRCLGCCCTSEAWQLRVSALTLQLLA